ncbi:UDP-N-acetylmuramate dehydrogenase [Leptospira sp. GIMC2001]|uniref:UDP-N-acetylmuramate dehydrogenase n=1 Tax=Leptospira sp. GIMC2001 TaxID=1513297 RepID=UPI00234B30A8|nr:UDP-N-acetylmuramate dehydrogenase [Leptospira sp. GIMC2001]WCL50021.1 UDP-N-acetylmuramate dehydrogenase [Leptospira sp. GIMC2001]
MKSMLIESQLQELIRGLDKFSVPYRKDVSLAILSSFKIGGVSPLIVEPNQDSEIFEVLNLFRQLDIPYRVLGGGSNILISDHPDDFVVFRLSGDYKNYEMIEPGIFEIGGATNTTPVFRQISQKGFTGAEFLSTIPGWTGGAVIQNAGCYGGELLDLVSRIDFVRDGVIQSKKPSEIEYGYRFTEFLRDKDSIILRIQMQLQAGNLIEIEESLKDKRDKRNSSQPENKKSAGSIFRNPKVLDEDGKPIKAWQLIDRAGLRGVIQGGAQISPEHCNFIVNLGGAKAVDVHYLSELIMEKVEKTSGILLEREVENFGTIP